MSVSIAVSMGQIVSGGEEGRSEVSAEPVMATSSADDSRHCLFDMGCFHHFAPLLCECQDLSKGTAYRFHKEMFHGELYSVESEWQVGQDRAHWQTGQERAAPVVKLFTLRVQNGEEALLEEAMAAFRIDMSESIRNSFITSLKEHDLLPSADEDGECSYEDPSLPIPVLAQRLANDIERRGREARNGDGAGLGL